MLDRQTLDVSVVIPFFEGHARLDRALRSIQQQTFRPREILVVDDGSSAPPTLPVDSAHHVPIRIVRHSRNLGIPAARNTGIREARGEWIAFLDQDDEWVADKLERQWRCLQKACNPEQTIVFGRSLVKSEAQCAPGNLFPARAVIARIQSGGRITARELLLRGNVIPFITILAHRSVFQRHGALDTRLTGGSDDYEFVLRLAADGLTFICADSVRSNCYSAVHYWTGQNYSDPEKFFSDDVALIRSVCQKYEVLAPLERYGLARTHYRLARSLNCAGAAERALRHHRLARALDPWWPAPWVAIVFHHSPPRLQRCLVRARNLAHSLKEK